MKCPCENCLVLVMCKGNKILRLISKCDRLLDYVQNIRCATRAIEIIRPSYYHKRKKEGLIPSIANTIMTRAEQLYRKNKSHKRKVQ